MAEVEPVHSGTRRASGTGEALGITKGGNAEPAQAPALNEPLRQLTEAIAAYNGPAARSCRRRARGTRDGAPCAQPGRQVPSGAAGPPRRRSAGRRTATRCADARASRARTLRNAGEVPGPRQRLFESNAEVQPHLSPRRASKEKVCGPSFSAEARTIGPFRGALCGKTARFRCPGTSARLVNVAT